MKRNNRLLSVRRELRKAVPLFWFMLCWLLLTTFFGCGAISTIKMSNQMIGFMKEMATHLREREQVLIESAERPLTENQEKRLTQLFETEGSLKGVLSRQAYLTYLEEQSGAVYKDYPNYLATVPTTEQKSSTSLALREILPAEATDEHLRICLDFYYESRELFVLEPDITADSEEIKPFLEERLIRPLMDTYPSEGPDSDYEVTTMIKTVQVPMLMALTDRDVYRKIWLKQLEVYGSREGLLRCAILTPGEFALTRSFFENIDAFEKWIRQPPKQK